ncbi:DUF6882 domain-containing protein [Streptomyces niveus]|uniref:DUF6882 domain-containing protein n=1 Tax=Streptomyces niveus TaxID=193462 RepID=UPI0003C5954D|nr:hypothetical protein M877_37995 [Streptomyces niveus NCIMB 11891]
MTVTTTFSDPFRRLTERHAAWGAQQLEAFTEFMPAGPWTADLDQRLHRQAGLELRISVLGSFDTTEGSWLWGWANPGFGGTPVVGAADGIRRLGEAHGIPDFGYPGVQRPPRAVCTWSRTIRRCRVPCRTESRCRVCC